jgi:hypothetical protein
VENSLFHKGIPKSVAPTPYELIEPEIVHLKKGYSIRYGKKTERRAPPWLMVVAFLGLAWLYLMDPAMHAWYKGEAMRTYVYLHNYGSAKLAQELVASRILTTDEATMLDHQLGSFQDYYSTPQAAIDSADTIIKYQNGVQLLHAGKYAKLDPVGRMRYLLFVKTNLLLPISWDWLDPSVSEAPQPKYTPPPEQ